MNDHFQSVPWLIQRLTKGEPEARSLHCKLSSRVPLLLSALTVTHHEASLVILPDPIKGAFSQGREPLEDSKTLLLPC